MSNPNTHCKILCHNLNSLFLFLVDKMCKLKHSKVNTQTHTYIWADTLCNFLQSSVTSSLLKPNIPHSTLFSNLSIYDCSFI
jgi:hypothetical protein